MEAEKPLGRIKLTTLGSKLLTTSMSSLKAVAERAQTTVREAEAEHMNNVILLVKDQGGEFPRGARIKVDEQSDGTYLEWYPPKAAPQG